MYTVTVPVKRPVWKDQKVIGYITCSMKDRDFLNAVQNEVYFGFTDQERNILNDGTIEELRKAGFFTEEGGHRYEY